MTEDHKVIWLQPWCAGCEMNRTIHSYEGRQWCEDDVWEKCDGCGAKSVRYEIAKPKRRKARPPKSSTSPELEKALAILVGKVE